MTLKNKKELSGQTQISGRKYIPDCGNSGEGPGTIKDKCAVENGEYLIRLEHGVGSADGETEATAKQCMVSTELRCSYSTLWAMENNNNCVSGRVLWQSFENK